MKKKRKEGNEFERLSSSVMETTSNDEFNIHILLFFLNLHSFIQTTRIYIYILKQKKKKTDTLDDVD